MNPEDDFQDTDFQDLRRLLALKRYEQPPPRYFNEFSSHVIGRIRATRQTVPLSLGQRWFGPHAPWLRGLASTLQTRPLLAGASGAMACGLLILGIVSSEQSVPDMSVSSPVVPDFTFAPASQQHPQPLLSAPGATQLSEGGWVPASQPSLFDQIQMAPPVRSVSYQP